MSISGVDVVTNYKYLGLFLKDRLDWSTNTDAVYKGMSRLYLFRKLRSLSVYSKMLEIFYQYVVASVISFAVVCCGGSISSRDASRINRVIRKAGSIIGQRLDTFDSVRDRRTNCYRSWKIRTTPTFQKQWSCFCKDSFSATATKSISESPFCHSSYHFTIIIPHVTDNHTCTCRFNFSYLYYPYLSSLFIFFSFSIV